MIFVTVGTHYLKFNRLIKMIESLKTNEKIVVQTGTTRVVSKSIITQEYFKFGKMVDLIKSARCVVTHGGPATIFQVLTFGSSLPIVLPRRKKYQEHVSDHQYAFSKYLQDFGKVILVQNKQELTRAIKNPMKNKHELENNAVKMVANISEWINGLA